MRRLLSLAAVCAAMLSLPVSAQAERVVAVDPAAAAALVALSGMSPESSAIVAAQSDGSYYRITDGTDGRVIVAQIVLPADGDLSKLGADAATVLFDGVPPAKTPACWEIELLPSIGRDFGLCVNRKRPTQVQTDRGLRSKPSTIKLSKTDKVVRLKWKKWGAKKSVAKGIVDFRVQGQRFRVPVTVTASRRASCGSKQFPAPVYRRLSFKMTRAADRAHFKQQRAVVQTFRCP